jgi:hypothetical protein
MLSSSKSNVESAFAVAFAVLSVIPSGNLLLPLLFPWRVAQI